MNFTAALNYARLNHANLNLHLRTIYVDLSLTTSPWPQETDTLHCIRIHSFIELSPVQSIPLIICDAAALQHS